MNDEIIPPLKKAITGDSIKEEIEKIREERIALIEGLLYEKSVLMLAADPGAGKSTIIANVLASLSVGLPVFRSLYTPKERICYYIPFERGKEEIIERLKMMYRHVPMDFSNIYINENFIGMDVTRPAHADEIINTVRHDLQGRQLDLGILDPIYASVSGGLSSDEKASQFCRFSARFQSEFKCSMWLNHHTVKETYTVMGEKINKSDSFYGSQWLKAHCTAAYEMRKTEAGVMLINKKDSQGNLIENLNLGFNPDDFTQYAIDYEKEAGADVRFKTFLRAQFHSKTMFTFAQIKGYLRNMSQSWLRRKLTHPEYTPHLKKHKSNGDATLYEVLNIDF